MEEQKVHKCKVTGLKDKFYILTKGKGSSLYLFKEDKWDAFFDELMELSQSNGDAKMYMRYLMRTAIQVEVDDEQEIEIPDLLWEHLTAGKEDAEIVMVSAQKMEGLGRVGKYEPWVIAVK